MSILQSGATKSLAASYDIDNSLRFDSSAYLGRTPASTTNRQIWTISAWVKRSGLEDNSGIMGTPETGAAGGSGEDMIRLKWGTDDKLGIFTDTDGSFSVVTTALYRDPSSWYHVVCACDTTQGTDTNRLKFYVNGIPITDFSTTNWPSEDLLTAFNYIHEHKVGWGYGTGAEGLDGYLAEFYFIDGTQYAASVFGETDSDTNQWIPLDSDDVKDAVTFGTNGFYQKYGSTELANSFTDSSSSDHTITASGDAENVRGTPFVPGTGTTYTTVDAITSSGTWTCPTGVTSVKVLVVGGGGGGPGSTYPGGGGAGGLINHPAYTVVPGVEYDITIGTGGAGSGSYPGGTGVDSVFNVNSEGSGSPLTAKGGGGGAGHTGSSASTPVDGGSGGGGGGPSGSAGSATQSSQSGDSGTYGFGYDGGDGHGASSDWGGGGGGGAGGKGEDGNDGYTGGIGKDISADFGVDYGVAGFIAAGGASGGDSYAGVGGRGGGGNGASGTGGTAGNGTANTGSGGGGGMSGTGGSGGSGIVLVAYSITKPGSSSINFDGTGDYLSIPDSSDWDLGSTYTVEFWAYGDQSGWSHIVNHGDATGWYIRWSGTDYEIRSNSNTIRTSGTHAGNDVWQHFAVVGDGTDVEVYVDGVLDSTGSGNAAMQDSSSTLRVATNSGASGDYYTGYVTEIRISDTARYTTTFTPQTTEFTADANTKLLIHSDWTGGLGADSSGNYNSFTPTNLDANDQVLDSPTNNFCTLNPLNVGDNGSWNGSLQEGNLKISGSAGVVKITSTFALDNVNGSYWEVRWGASTDANCGIGLIGNANLTTSSQVGADPAYKESGYKGSTGVLVTDGSTEATYASSAEGTIVAFAYKAGRLYVGQVASGSAVPTWFNSGDPAAGTGYVNAVVKTDPTEWDAVIGLSHSVNFGQDSSFAGEETAQGNTDANGVGDFYATVPSGFLALCSDNLSAPEIALPEENFLPKIYTGVSGALTVTTGIEAGMIWLKGRNNVEPFTLFDTLRGALNSINPAVTAAEASIANSLTAFSSTGFSVGTADQTGGGYNYSSWNWKAGGTPTATNSAGAGVVPTAGSVKIDGSNLGSALAGTIAATKLSANTTAGFSIVTYTGTGSDATVAHGLSEAPDLIWVMRLTDAGYFKIISTTEADLTFAKYFRTDTNDAVGTGNYWQDADPSASVFSIVGADNSTNGSSKNFVGYCWHSVEGFSKIGGYTGNNNADGTFVYTGMSPSWVLIKATGAAQNWTQFDSARQTYNLNNKYFTTNAAAAETTGFGIDFLSNGFKPRVTDVEINSNDGNFLYMAFAESPFKTVNAR